MSTQNPHHRLQPVCADRQPLPRCADLGAACCANKRWADVLTHPAAWRLASAGLVWAKSEAVAEARAAAQGGWKNLLRHERALERRWKRYGLAPRVIAQGHDHWVPSILMEPATRQLVTCSYDGTIRFWADVDAPESHCFKVLTGAEGEGFSAIALWAPSGGQGETARLAAGSDWGSVHVWEVWRPDDAEDAAAAAEAQEWPVERALAQQAAAAAAEGVLEQEALEAALAARPRFARRLECWTGSQDFVQSVLMLGPRTVVSGADSGSVALHRVGQPDVVNGEAQAHEEGGAVPPALCLSGHESTVMCLGATDDGDVLSGSADHTVRLWDPTTGQGKARFLGHTRSVHCLALGQATAQGASMLFTGSRDHRIKVWDLRTQGCEFTLRGHVGSVTCLGADGWKLLSGGGYNRGSDDDEVLSVDATLRLWDLRMLGSSARTPCLWTKAAPSPEGGGGGGGGGGDEGEPVLSLQLLPDKVLTSHGGKKWTARIWDLERGPEASTAEERQGG